MTKVQLYAFDILALNGDDLRHMPLSTRKAHLSRLLARRPDGIFVARFEAGEIGPDPFRAACDVGVEGLGVEAAGSALSGRPIEGLGQVKNRSHPAIELAMDVFG
jgi:ATP-dependent DNA ligase